MATTVLAQMAVKIAANTAEFTKALQKTESQVSSFGKQLTSIAGTIGIAFGAQQVASFALEVSKLAGEAEGVQAAFDRLPESIKLMNDLKEATGGTVSELDLMKRSVQAANFGISLEALPKLLEFAALRAQQTGQSVDYLVDSIITGIGRKSPLILDNLGISAVRLKEKFNGASLEAQNIGSVAEAVGKIAEEELGKMAGFAENTSSKIQRLNASWENTKVALGDAANGTGILGSGIDKLIEKLDVFSSKYVSFGTKLLDLFSPIQTNQALVEEALNKTRDALDEQRPERIFNAYVKGYKDVLEGANKFIEAQSIAKDGADEQLIRINELIAVNPKLAESQEGIIRKLKAEQNVRNELIKYAYDFIKAQQDLKKGNDDQVITLDSLQAKLKDLNDQFSSTNTTDQKRLVNIAAQINATKEQIKAIEDLLKVQSKQVSIIPELDLSKVSKTLGANLQLPGFDSSLLDVSAEAIEKRTDEMIGKLQTVPAKLQTVGQEISDTAVNISGMIASGIAGIADALGESLASGDFRNFGQELLTAVASFAQQLGGLMIAMGLGEIALKGAPGPAKIAAGAALVAVGAAVKALLGKQKNFPNAGSGGSGGSSRVTSPEQFRYQNGNQIELSGQFIFNGRELQLALDANNQRSNRLG